MTTVELILHPVRLRIVQAFLGGRELTTAEVSAELPDLPNAGLYRHVALLARSGVLRVVSERQVRGAVERRYALRLDRAWLGPKQLATLTRDENAQVFATFTAGLLSDYERYLASGKPDLARDGVSYSMNAMWLSDNELKEFLHDLAGVIAPRAKLGPARGRRRRLTASVFMPLTARPIGGAQNV
jgi:hypothetical protein